jgi:hypothetical protein
MRHDPDLRFAKDGYYDLSTIRRQLAACKAALETVALIPRVHDIDGSVFCRDEMQRVANELLVALTVQPGWPRCPGCGLPSLDGHSTCGDVVCDKGGRR